MMETRELVLQEGEKYALIGLRSSSNISTSLCSSSELGLWVSSKSPVKFNDHWEKWLGSIRSEHLTNANLFLTAKGPASSPSVLDEENERLKRQVYWFYTGLLLSVRLTTFDDPLMLTGAAHAGYSDVRQVGHVTKAAPILGFLPEPVTIDGLAKAVAIASALQEWGASGGSWRFNHVLHIYLTARENPDPLERIHQFSRCIEGLILPETGKTKRQFVSRTETFVGPKEHARMGAIYDVRSAVEHLREYEILDPPTRPSREGLLQKAAIMEYLSRRCIGRVLLTKSLWPHFAGHVAIESFWKLPSADRRRLWGAPVNLASDLADFSPQFLRDADLGLG
jgi:hypothetical protein